MSNNERERAVKRLKEDLLFAHETAKKHGGTADRSMFSVTDLRLLLKAYQEQRRALEPFANKDNEFGSEVQTIADTALNQKGDKL